MLQIGLVGLGAGAAAALLFASVTSGTWMSVPLFYLAPLPIMIAGLGWSHWSALVAALVASIALGVVFSSLFFVAFLAGAGLPAWWLAYLALLARPADNAVAALEWYPPGRLVIWAAVLAAAVVAAGILFIGTDADTVRSGLVKSLSRLLRPDPVVPADGQLPMANSSNSDRVVSLLATVLPAAAAVIATITSVFNLWLAARIVRYSGRLTRPWPQLSEMTFPKLFTAALAAALILSLLDSIVGIVAGVASAAMLMAYGVLGFAVLHSISRNFTGRAFVLGGTYGSVLLFGWPILGLCLLGISETVLDWRARAAARRGPPTPL